MRAVVIKEFGPPSVLVPADVAEPTAGPGQALIDVAIANITFVETQVRAGKAPNPAMAPSSRPCSATAWAAWAAWWRPWARAWTDPAAAHRVRVDARPLEGLPGGLQQQPLLRVHGQRPHAG